MLAAERGILLSYTIVLYQVVFVRMRDNIPIGSLYSVIFHQRCIEAKRMAEHKYNCMYVRMYAFIHVCVYVCMSGWIFQKVLG